MIKGIGIEMVDTGRFKSAVERRGSRLLRRLFTDRELEYSLGQRSPERHLAARFACKMSFFKAAGRRYGFREVEVLRDGNGRPRLKVEGIGGDLRFTTTISHSGKYSIATTVVERA